MAPQPPAVGFVTETAWMIETQGRRHYVSCTESSAVMGVAWANPAIPETVEEARQLYAIGPHGANGGSTQASLCHELDARYGHTPEQASSLAAALAALRSGAVLAMAGDYHDLPASLQRWDRAFASHPDAAHEVAVGPIAPDDLSIDPLVWWRDPLGHGAYVGEWVRWSVAVAFGYGRGYILVFPQEAWAMIRYNATDPIAGTVAVEQGPLVRLIDLATGRLVAPTATSYPLTWTIDLLGVIFGGLPRHRAYLVVQAGRLFALLAENAATITPPSTPPVAPTPEQPPAVVPPPHSFTVTRDDGVVVGTFS